MASPGSVLIIVENLPVPFDRRVWMESRALAAAGYDVSVVSRRERRDGWARTTRGVHVYRHDMPLEADSPRGYLVSTRCALWREWRLARRVDA